MTDEMGADRPAGDAVAPACPDEAPQRQTLKDGGGGHAQHVYRHPSRGGGASAADGYIEKVYLRPSRLPETASKKYRQSLRIFREANFYTRCKLHGTPRWFHVPAFRGIQATEHHVHLYFEDLVASGFQPADDLPRARLNYNAPNLARAIGEFNVRATLASEQQLAALSVCRSTPWFCRLPRRYRRRLRRGIQRAPIARGRRRFLWHYLRTLYREFDAFNRGIPAGSWGLCHGDIFWGNVFLRGELRFGFIDFEHYAHGPLGLDLGRFCGKAVLLSEPFSTPVDAQNKYLSARVQEFMEWIHGCIDGYMEGVSAASRSVKRADIERAVGFYFSLMLARDISRSLRYVLQKPSAKLMFFLLSRVARDLLRVELVNEAPDGAPDHRVVFKGLSNPSNPQGAV